MVMIYKDDIRQIGWAIKLTFRIGLHKKDLAILEHIRDYFGKGIITSDIDARIRFESLKDIVPLFL